MALALKIPLDPKKFVDPKKLALARAKFHAWWEGEAFNEEAALAAVEAKLAAQAANDALKDAAEEDLFEFEWPSRLKALTVLWGQGRLRPGDAAQEAELITRLSIPADGVLAFLSPGLAAPVIAAASAHAGRIDVFEWRDESFDALKHGIREAKLHDRVSIARIDIEAHAFKPSEYDGLLSVDDFAYSGYPPHLAQQLMKCLKPGACAIAEAYVGLPSQTLATAFASSFAEPQIRAHGDVIKFFTDVGLALDTDDDVTDAFLSLAKGSFKRLGEGLTEAGALDVHAAQELAWEAEAWRMRMRLMAQRRLERRRFVVRRPAEGEAQVENTNAPEA
jgi:hypothetical protein